MTLARWVAALAIALVGGSSIYAQPCGDLSRRECVQGQLETEDRALNELYARLIEEWDQDAVEQLRAEQRRWISDRDRACNLAPGSTRDENWIARVAADSGQALCVYGSTHARLEHLRQLTAVNRRPPEDLIDKHEISFPVSHHSGKWYAEATFLAANYDRDGNDFMQVAATDGSSLVGMQVPRAEMRREATANGTYVAGIALDMDNGKMYWSANGTWRNGSPGSAEGTALPRGENYTIRIISSGPNISRDLDLGFITLNTGRTPFVHAMPAGFQPFFTSPNNVAGGSRVEWIVPPYKKVAGAGLPQWAERYWAWLLAKPAERSPTQDTTGEFCADAQAGPVWFLAGGDARSHITRVCRVPRGKFILLPPIVQIIYSTNGAQTCAELEAKGAARDGVDAIQSAYIILDEERFDALHDFRPYSTRCTSIRGPAGEIVVSDAIFYGVWVMLQPLPEGEHVIRFGGELPALNTYRDVTYRIRVE
jgi:uncharacterized protein YecT (DUF1311 family)